MSMDERYDFLHEVLGIGTDALDLAFAMTGYNEETADKILYWYTGYSNFEQYEEECC